MKRVKPSLTIFFFFLFVIPELNAQTLWSQKMASTIMSNYPSGYKDASSTWTYVIGTVLKGFEDLYVETGDSTYKKYVRTTVDLEVNSDGSMKTYKTTDYNSDQMREGNALLFLYRLDGTAKYKTASATIRSQIEGHPRTSEGGFWHKKSYPYQMWQDGLYMVEPFYAQYAVLLNNSATADLDDIANQFILMETHARDTVSGLIYHGWDEKKTQVWANSETGCSSCFWGRAMGWYGMALVDVLDYFPESHSKRAELIAIFQRLMTALIKYQEPTSGCWYQVVDYTTTGYGPDNGNYLESSASCMYAYCLLKGVRMGYLDESFKAYGTKAYEGILSTFVTETSGKVVISKTCSSAGLGGSNNRMGNFAYYMSESIVSNDGKAMGPFISGSLEYERLTTGVQESQQTSDFRVIYYPGPNQLTLFSIELANTPSQLTVTTIDGKNIIKQQIDSNNTTKTLSLPELQPGIYIASIRGNSYKASKKFVVQ